MERAFILLLFTLLAASCEVEETKPGGAGGLFSEHKQVENSISVSGPSAGLYVETDELYFRVSHPYPMAVTGNPRIALDMGGSTVYANYISGTGTKTLVFRYTIQAGDNDSDGLSFASAAVDLNGGTVEFDGTAGTSAITATFTAPDISSAIVDTTAPGVPTITAPLPLTYYLGDRMTFTAAYDETVFVTGTPQMPFILAGSTVYADYVTGSGTDTLVFKYTVNSSDYDMDGITIPAPIGLNGGTIKDEAGNDATLVYGLTNHGFVYVDGDSPVVQTFIPPADGTYQPGDNLDFSLQFSEIVNVTGAPRVAIDIGGNTVYAAYNSGTGTNTLLFRYPVVSGHEDDDGVDVANIIDMNGGSIQDAGGRDAYDEMDAPATPGALVDAPLPTVTSVTLPTPPADNYFNSGEEIYITLNFNDVVNVTGYPQLGLSLDSSGSTIYVDYNSGTGTSSLVFRYVVVDETDEDHDGFELVSPLNLNGGVIQNDAGTYADLDLTTAITGLDTSAMLVDATTPVVDSITAPANDTYIIGEQVDFVLNFSEIVNVTGSPRIALDIGGSTRYAAYATGTGTTALTFRWTVQQNYEDTNGIQVTSTAIDPAGGSIEDRGGNTANYDITGLTPSLASVFVDGVRPAISSIAIAANTYVDTDTISATVTFDDTVVVAGGSPLIAATFDQAAGTSDFVYQSGTGTTALTLEYTVAGGDLDEDGIALASSVSLSGATIQDVNGNDAVLTHTDTSFPAVLIDAVAPVVTITSPVNGDYINSSADSLTYAISGTCDDITASYDIQVDGVSAAGQAGVSCDGANLSGTFNTTGIAQGAFTLTVVGTDVSANSTTSAGVSVTKDTLAPSIDSVVAPGAGNYVLNDNLDFTVNFDEAVTVSGTRIAITLATGTVYANYNSGTGTTAIGYRYTAGASDHDSDGIAISSPIDLNGGTITDAAGNSATLIYAPPGTGGITVNDGTPAFSWNDSGMSPIASYDYGNPNATVSATFYIENTGTAPSTASINVAVTLNPARFSIVTDNCSGIVLPINGTCSVIVDYADPAPASVPEAGEITADDSGYGVNPGYGLTLNGD